MILWYATHQHATGRSRPARIGAARSILFDYNAYWVEDIYDYVLYTGDLALAKQVWPSSCG